MTFRQVLIYGAPVPEVEAPNAAWDAFNDLTNRRHPGVITQSEANQHTVIVGVLLTDPADLTTLKVCRAISDLDRAVWQEFAAQARAVLGVDLGEPSVWFCVVEVM